MRSTEESSQGKNWIKLSTLAKDPQFQGGSGDFLGKEWGKRKKKKKGIRNQGFNLTEANSCFSILASVSISMASLRPDGRLG